MATKHEVVDALDNLFKLCCISSEGFSYTWDGLTDPTQVWVSGAEQETLSKQLPQLDRAVFTNEEASEIDLFQLERYFDNTLVLQIWKTSIAGDSHPAIVRDFFRMLDRIREGAAPILEMTVQLFDVS